MPRVEAEAAAAQWVFGHGHLRDWEGAPTDLAALLADPAGEDHGVDAAHGAGERGSDLSRVAKHGPTKLIHGENLSPAEAAIAPLVRDSFIVAAPQCPEGSWWNPTDVLALIDHLLATQPVDPNRIYLTGLSMGGYGTWGWAGARPERFAAIALIVAERAGDLREGAALATQALDSGAAAAKLDDRAIMWRALRPRLVPATCSSTRETRHSKRGPTVAASGSTQRTPTTAPCSAGTPKRKRPPSKGGLRAFDC